MNTKESLEDTETELTNEGDDSVDLVDFPVNVEIITDEEDPEEELAPSKKRKIAEPNSRKPAKKKSARECFEEYFTDEVFETIVRETERYAVTVKKKQEFAVTVTDVKILLGFIIFAGYHRLPSERDYWSDDEDLGIPLVKAAITRNAFAELKSCLHFQDNSKARENQTDKAFKIRPLMEILNKNFQKWEGFRDSLSVGEIVVLCYGVNRARQRKSVGCKFGVMCGDGYCYKFWLSSGQNVGDVPMNSGVQPFQNTLHSEVAKPDSNQQTGNKKFTAGVKYYKLLLKKHSIPIRGKKWYWYLFTRMIDMAIVNAYHVYRVTQDSHKCIKDFRREIAVPYLKLGHCRSVTRSSAPKPSRTHVNEDVRFDGLNHIIGKRNKQRRCQFQNCKGRPKTYCVKCNITLCITCFQQFHFR